MQIPVECPHPNLLPPGEGNYLSPLGEGWGEGFRLFATTHKENERVGGTPR